MNHHFFDSPRFLGKGLSVLMLSLALLSPLAQGSFATSTQSETVRIQADHQIYNMETKQYQLKGNVHVAYQNMTISGSEATMDVDATGQPSIAKFTNRPSFKRIAPDKGEDKIVADTISIYLKDNSFGAEGNVQSQITTVASDPFTIRADVQRFDSARNIMTADGKVNVLYQGTAASSARAMVRMAGGKAERVIFSGGAKVDKEDSQVTGEKITVLVDSGNLIAENNVKTVVTQKNNNDKIYIYSDYQQYDKASDQMLASGHVKLIFGDYVATGPKATFKLKGNDLDRILLTGRPTIKDKERVITADTIVITTNPKNFDAKGNVKIQFQAKKQPATATPAAQPTSAGSSAPQLPEDTFNEEF